MFALNKTMIVKKFGSFPFVPPVTQHVSLHCNSLFKNMAPAFGGANNMHQLSWGGIDGKDPKFFKPFHLLLISLELSWVKRLRVLLGGLD